MEFSSREVAQHSVSERRDVLESLAASLDPQSAERLRALDEALDEQEPDERYTAYRAIGRLLRYGLREADAQAVRQAIDYLYLAGRMERYFAEVMFYRVREIRMNSLIDRETYTAEELLARRRELYATEDTTERYRKLLEWSEELQHLSRAHVDFDPRDFGHQKLSTLVAEQPYLEHRSEGGHISGGAGRLENRAAAAAHRRGLRFSAVAGALLIAAAGGEPVRGPAPAQARHPLPQ